MNINDKLIKIKIFKKYEDYLINIPDNEKKEVDTKFLSTSYARIIISAVLFFFISSFSILNDLLSGFYKRPDEPLNYLNLIALIIVAVMSIIILIVYFINKNKVLTNKYYRMNHLIYFITLNTSLQLFFISEFSRGMFLTFEEFYWLFFAAVPLLKLRYNFINYAVMFTSFFTTYTVINCIYDYNFWENIYLILFLIVCMCFGLYLRSYFLSTLVLLCENKDLNEKLKKKSEIDPLTNCLNRYVLNEKFESLIKSEKSLCFMMIDIDDFKQYNDGFSHVVGDECLKKISESLQKKCSESNSFLFRYGGEEFLVISVDMKDNEIIDFSLKLLYCVRDIGIKMPVVNSNKKLRDIVTISIGSSKIVCHEYDCLKNVIELADKQLYLAKKDGKNCIYYNNKKYN